MKKPISLFVGLLLAFTNVTNAQKKTAQTETVQTETAIYKAVEKVGTMYTSTFSMIKTDPKTQKVISKMDLNIPDKDTKGTYNSLANYFTFDLIGENIIMIYEVWQKKTSSKDCYIKLLNVKNDQLGEAKLLFSTKLNSVYSSNELLHRVYYSPDKSKMAILKDNISVGYEIDPELNVYDTKTFSVLSIKKISGKFEGQKRVFDLSSVALDNKGDITAVLHLMNEKTKVTTKSYSATIPLNETDLKNFKELDGNTSSEGDGGDQNSHGHFYKNMDDYLNNKPIEGVRIKNGSFGWTTFGGTKYKLIDDEGNIKKEGVDNLPSDIFTYKNNNISDPYLIRMIEKEPYIVLFAGKLSYYSAYLDQPKRYYAEGWNGKLERFSDKDFEVYLKKYDLLEDYKKDKPKREFQDDVNGYFNKTIRWQVKYFGLVNKKMS